MSSLRLSTESDPWSISFGVLQQAAPAGFWCEPRWSGEAVRAGTSDPAAPDWHRVTRVRTHQRTDDGLSVVLDTDHPDGRAAKARITVHGRDWVEVTFSVPGAAIISQSFITGPGERFLGFGERSHAVSLDSGVVENYVGEGPYQPHEYPFLAGTVPPWAIRERLDATYFPLPWAVSTRGYGLSIDQDDVTYLRLRADAGDSWSIEAEADRLAFTVYAGPAPLDALRRYTELYGRQPAPARPRTTGIRPSFTAPRSRWRPAWKIVMAAGWHASSGPAGPARRQPFPSCGVATRPPPGATTAWPAR